MRIAVVTTSYPANAGDAAGHFVASEAAQLVDAGHDVTVCAPGIGARHSIFDDSAARIRVVRLGAADVFTFPGALPRLRERPTRLFAAGEFVLRARAWLKRNGPFDLIQAHWLLPCGWPIASHLDTPLEVVCHGSDVELFSKLPAALQRHITRPLSNDETRLRFVSNQLCAELERIAPSLCKRRVIAPCAIDTAVAPDRNAARHSLAIRSQRRIAVVIGRLISSKRIDLALNGLAQIPDLETFVIGDGPLRNELTTRFPAVKFLGQLPRPDTLRWLSAANVLVSASIREGAPTVIREARQLDVPVVASDVGDLRSWAQEDPGIALFQTPSELIFRVKQALGVLPKDPSSYQEKATHLSV